MMWDGDEINLAECYYRGIIRASCPRERTELKIDEDCDKHAPVPSWENGYPKEMERIYALEYAWEAELQRRSQCTTETDVKPRTATR